MSEIAEHKKALRLKLIELRMSITPEDWTLKSELIQTEVFKNSFFQRAKTIHCFVSMNERNEVDTFPILDRILSFGKKLVVPVTDFESGLLHHSEIQSLEELAPNKWGVLEPISVKSVAAGEIDLVLVPLLAGDEKGNRLGYGKGFYDRFLSQTACPKLGLIFHDFILPKVPVDKFDVQLDGFITENGVRYL